MVVGSYPHAGVPGGVVPVRVGEVAVPVLAVLTAPGSADGTTVQGTISVHTVSVPDTSGHVAVLPFCIRVVCVAPRSGFVAF